jgi:hypothetical protein
MAEGMVQGIEYMHSKPEALSSNPSITNNLPQKRSFPIFPHQPTPYLVFCFVLF